LPKIRLMKAPIVALATSRAVSSPSLFTRAQDHLAGLWAWVDRRGRPLLLLLVLGYFLLFSAASIYKLETLQQGFDLAGNEQTIWNTLHGRPFQTSVFALMRYDFDDGPVLLQLPLAALYALYPSAHILLVLQTAAIALGALPLYWLVRDRLGHPSAGLVAAALYLLHPTVQHINLYEFQYRSFSMCFVLYAFYFFERRKWGLWALFLFLAVATKTESALVVVSFGLYALLRRERWTRVVPPIVGGALWFVVALFVVVPYFTTGTGSFVGGIYSYGYLGNSFGEIVRTLLTRPLFVLQHLVEPDKVAFLFDLLFISAFLPLLSPAELLLPAPILVLNLLSPNPVQYSLYYQYQGLTVPFLLIGSFYGLDRLQRFLSKRLRWNAERVRNVALLFLVLFALGNCALWKNALWSVLQHRDTATRIADARAILAQVPPESPVAASSFLAPFVARREGLYFFPGNRSYPEEYITQADYIVTDTSDRLPARGHELLDSLTGEGTWQVVARQGDFLLLKHVAATPVAAK
jgi:uncharacterized membrane protein